LLYAVAGLRRWRRGHAPLSVGAGADRRWLARIESLATRPAANDAAIELAECQRLVKGYSDTHERGLKNFGRVVDAVQRLSDQSGPRCNRQTPAHAALADEEGRLAGRGIAELKMAG
jgi:indolepyruvate ferredoxin oxidoreductase beta subunit